MAEYKDINLMLTTVEQMKRKTFSDEEKARLLKSLRPFELEDINAAEEPLCRRRYFPQYGDVIDAVEAAKATRLGLNASTDQQYDAGPAPDDENLAKIQKRLGPVRFKSWFTGSEVSIEGDTATLLMPGRAAVDWVKRDMIPEIAAALGVDYVRVALKGAKQ
ncbi:MAG: hypothetical protein AXW12_00625 [Thalassospira sp. Nap_22]|nr:MAG: hypothetical protein AXW12_00625 [Thalassospira sp. Nap_22]